MKKAQLQHVFAFMMMVLIAGAVILMGYKFISGIMSSSAQLDLLDFSKNIDTYVNKYNTFGDFNPEKIMVPQGVQGVCFISAKSFEKDANGNFKSKVTTLNNLDIGSFENVGSIESILLDAVNFPESQPSNVFVIDNDKNVVPLNNLFLKKLEVDDHVLCLSSKAGYFHIDFTGKGKTTLLEDGTQAN